MGKMSRKLTLVMKRLRHKMINILMQPQENKTVVFYVLLTVHLGIIFVTNQLDT